LHWISLAVIIDHLSMDVTRRPWSLAVFISSDAAAAHCLGLYRANLDLRTFFEHFWGSYWRSYAIIPRHPSCSLSLARQGEWTRSCNTLKFDTAPVAICIFQLWLFLLRLVRSSVSSISQQCKIKTEEFNWFLELIKQTKSNYAPHYIREYAIFEERLCMITWKSVRVQISLSSVNEIIGAKSWRV